MWEKMDVEGRVRAGPMGRRRELWQPVKAEDRHISSPSLFSGHWTVHPVPYWLETAW